MRHQTFMVLPTARSRDVHTALDAGITLLDTGDFYGIGHNELLLQRSLAGTAAGKMCSLLSNSVRCGLLTAILLK